MMHSGAVRLWTIVGGVVVLAASGMGPLAHAAQDLFFAHMVQHVLAMSVAALLVAFGCNTSRPWLASPIALVAATLLQLGALVAWHLPSAISLAHHNGGVAMLMQASLFLVALLFWCTIIAGSHGHVWLTIFALLITAKGLCLVGVVLVFSRRQLVASHGDPQRWGLSALEDQHLAGLVMTSSCMLVYVAAAVVLFARWLADVGTQPPSRISHAAAAD
jgi:putative membrane protein